MPKSTRTIKLPASKTAKPVAAPSVPLAAAANAQQAAGRSNVIKPVSVAANVLADPRKPVAGLVVSTTAKPVAEPKPTSLARDASGITGATDFTNETPRDLDYLRFFGSVARKNNHAATVRQLYDAGVSRIGRHPSKHYIPNTGNRSTKATDRDSYDRLACAGYVTISGPADSENKLIRATDKAKTSIHYNGKA